MAYRLVSDRQGSQSQTVTDPLWLALNLHQQDPRRCHARTAIWTETGLESESFFDGEK